MKFYLSLNEWAIPQMKLYYNYILYEWIIQNDRFNTTVHGKHFYEI